MPYWPFYMAAAAFCLGVTWHTDRAAFISYVTVLCGLVAMQIPFGIPRFFPAFTIWSIVAAAIFISTNSILSVFLAVMVALAYLPAVFGWPWHYVAKVSDVAGVCLLAALIFPTIRDVVDGADRNRDRLVDSGPLPAWPRQALAALVGVQKSAPREALEREL